MSNVTKQQNITVKIKTLKKEDTKEGKHIFWRVRSEKKKKNGVEKTVLTNMIEGNEEFVKYSNTR